MKRLFLVSLLIASASVQAADLTTPVDFTTFKPVQSLSENPWVRGVKCAATVAVGSYITYKACSKIKDNEFKCYLGLVGALLTSNAVCSFFTETLNDNYTRATQMVIDSLNNPTIQYVLNPTFQYDPFISTTTKKTITTLDNNITEEERFETSYSSAEELIRTLPQISNDPLYSVTTPLYTASNNIFSLQEILRKSDKNKKYQKEWLASLEKALPFVTKLKSTALTSYLTNLAHKDLDQNTDSTGLSTALQERNTKIIQTTNLLNFTK